MTHHWHSNKASAKPTEAPVPTYQYACTSCGHQLEAVQSFSDDPLTVCPACEGKLRKLYSAVGIVFKGSGFYRTDSRSGSGAKSGAATTSTESSTSSTNGSGETKKADTKKPDTRKPDTKPAATASASS
jgi:putative FmdB family regulatory protein